MDAREAGIHSVGVVRDALVRAHFDAAGGDALFWSMPVVGETWDGVLNDINGQHGGIGTASRRAGEFTVGALVQANHGRRERLRIEGVAVGEAITACPPTRSRPTRRRRCR